MHLFTCKTYPEQYTDSTDAFRQEFNYHKCVHRNFFQAIVFNTHFMEASHNVEKDLKGRLIDQTHYLKERKKRGIFGKMNYIFLRVMNLMSVKCLFCSAALARRLLKWSSPENSVTLLW